jgi:DNA adenine methylase
METVIKWSGSKRSQSKEITKYFPKEINNYYELFLGGGSVMLKTLNNKEISVNKYIVNDINSDLINLWLNIQNNLDFLLKEYSYYWEELNKNDDGQRRKDYFNLLRSEFNKTRKPELFLILNRIVINGLIRYNKKNELNSTFHFSRKGITISNLTKILSSANKLINDHKVEFNNKSYDSFNINNENDLIYLDPPYFNTKNMYYGGIDYNNLITWLENQQSKIIISYDGIRGKEDLTVELPKNLYKRHFHIKSGKSSFNRLLNNKDTDVFESLYLNY